MTLLKRLVLVSCTAYILMFFSEYVFMNEGPVFDSVDLFNGQIGHIVWMFIELILWYAIPAYIFLMALAYFNTKTIWGLLLAGALYGFAVEGMIVWQMYEALPFTISWTPLGWHMLIDVLVGWYATRYLLLKGKSWQLAFYFIGIGVCWGVWATWYGIDQPLLTPTDFTTLVILLGGGWIVANGVMNFVSLQPFTPTRQEIIVVCVLAILSFSVQVITIFPLAVVVLPPLMAVTLWVLNRQKQNQTQQTILDQLNGTVIWHKTGWLFLTPISAILVYPFVYDVTAVGELMADLVPPFLMILGFIIYGLALWRTWVIPRQV